MWRHEFCPDPGISDLARHRIPDRAGRTAHLPGRFARALLTMVTIGACAVAGIVVVAAIATRLPGPGRYTIFGHPVMTVLSGSMTPVIRAGDLIVDDPVTAAQARHLHAGQIASFRLAPGSQTVITHRIASVVTVRGAVLYRTRGDANNGPDGELRPSADVAGIFRFDVPRGGYVLTALHRGHVLSLLAASLALWFLAGMLWRRARHGDQGKEALP